MKYNYTLASNYETLPVFKVAFYGIYDASRFEALQKGGADFSNLIVNLNAKKTNSSDGDYYQIPLELLERRGLGSLSGDGAVGIVLGKGRKSVSWNKKARPKNVNENDPEEQFKEILRNPGSIEVDYKDITEGANYLKLDINTMKVDAFKKIDQTYIEGWNSLFFKRIEPGSFRNVRDVKITDAYYISVSLISQIQWAKIIDFKFESESEENNKDKDVEKTPVKVSYEDICGKNEKEKYKSPPKSPKKGASFPFLSFLTGKTGGNNKQIGLFFDLPTEAQWEYALFEDKNGDDLYKREYVCEWCYDWYQKDLGHDLAYNPYGPYKGEGGKRVIRNATERNYRSGSVTNAKSSSNMYGFRLVLTAKDFVTFQIKYTTPYSESTLPTYTTNFYGIGKDGTKILLDELVGELTESGSMGIVFGSGNHTAKWETRKRYENLDLLVECKDVTNEATYLVLDIEEKKIRPVKEVNSKVIKSDAARTNELWFRRIEAGTFMMGTSEKDFQRYELICKTNIENGVERDKNRTILKDLNLCRKLEKQHEVKLTKSFYMAIFPTTQAQWKRVTEDGYNPSKYIGDMRPVEQIAYSSSGKKGKEGKEDYYYDVVNFLKALKQFDGKDLVFDIPTEAEWEYACRAGSRTDLNNGTNLTDLVQDDNLNKLGRYWRNGGGVEVLKPGDYRFSDSESDSEKFNLAGTKTIAGAHKGQFKFYKVSDAHSKVGSYLPNAWGLYDMHGNVFEWCLDWYQEDLGSATAKDPVGPEKGTYRVLRGGSWNSHAAFYCRSAYRNRHKQGNDPVISFDYCGFRLVLGGKNLHKITKDYED